MLRKINPRFIIGFHKEKYNIYNLSLDSNFKNKHITSLYKELLAVLGIKNPSLNYDVFLSEYEESYGKEIRKKFTPANMVFFNTYAAKKRKTFSFDKAADLITKILSQERNRLLLNADDGVKNNLKTDERIYIPERKDFLSIAALVKYSDIIITPDTSIVHVAAAFNKKMIALYMDDAGDDEKLNAVWAPNYPSAKQLIVDSGGNGEKNNIKNISNDLIIKEMKSMLGES